MNDRSGHTLANCVPEFVAKIAEILAHRFVGMAVLGLAMILQVTDASLDASSLFENGHVNAANLVGVGDFVIGCIAALFLKR